MKEFIVTVENAQDSIAYRVPALDGVGTGRHDEAGIEAHRFLSL